MEVSVLMVKCSRSVAQLARSDVTKLVLSHMRAQPYASLAVSVLMACTGMLGMNACLKTNVQILSNTARFA